MKSGFVVVPLGCLALFAGCRGEAPEKGKLESALPTMEVTGDAKPPSGEFDDPDFHVEVVGSKPCTPSAPFLPAPGLRRVIVALRVTSKSSRPVPVSPLAFQLEDKEGHRFGATLAGCGEPIKSVRLEQSASLEGNVAFDVPKGSRELHLVYEPFLLGRAKVTAVLTVTAPSGD